MEKDRCSLRWVWLSALALFILAGTTGALYRFGMLYGLPAGLQLQNVRHAHSHLMYMGWVTPVLMALITARLPAETRRQLPRALPWTIGITLLFALAVYPAFLAYGYEVVEIGDSRLPLAAILSSFNILAWYAFGMLYLRATWNVPRSRPLRLWDAAIGALVLASVGAWARGLVMGMGLESRFLSAATVYLFLDMFAEGWFVLALLGLLYAAYPRASSLSSLGSRLLVIGLPVTFLLSVPASFMPSWLRIVAGAGGVMVALGLLVHVITLWPHASHFWWRVPLGFLALKALAELGGSVPAIMSWALGAGLRIPYLHVLLLGFVSLGLFAAVRDTWGQESVPGQYWMIAVVALLIASLLPLTGLWPSALAGRWTLVAAAWIAVGPVVVAIGIIAGIFFHRQPMPSEPSSSQTIPAH